jgi:hypothetical protein
VKIGRLLRIVGLSLATILVLYLVLGSLYAWRLGQREETWHERAVALLQPADFDRWRRQRSRAHLFLEWELKAGPRGYRLRLYDDRGYLLYTGSPPALSNSGGEPVGRYVAGVLDRAAWRAVEDAAAALQPLHPQLAQTGAAAATDVRVRITHADGRRFTYRYSTVDYPRLPAALREFDDALYAAMAPSAIAPPHGHARRPASISYGVEELPALQRVLQGEREALYPSVVERMVDIGGPAINGLIEALVDGHAKHYRPASRYAAILDGLAAIDDPGGPARDAIRAVAERPSRHRAGRDLRRKAQAIVERFEERVRADDATL